MIFTKFISLLSVFFLSGLSFSFAQSDKVDCKTIKDGVFYAYSNYEGSVITIRSGARQQQVKEQSDTTTWKVSWISNCVYSLQLESGFKSDKALAALYKKHKRIINVTGVTEDYYLYKSYMDNITDADLPSDTMWLKEQDFSNRQTFILPC